jgi:type I restriction enzyme S subunit
MRLYPSYKESGKEWVGTVPDTWSIKPLFALFQEKQTLNHGNYESNVLSLSHGRIIRRDVESNFGLLPESFETYNIVEPQNIVLRLTDLQNDKRSLRCGFVKEKGIITSAYLTLENTSDVDCKYIYYLLHNYDIRKVFYGMGGGVRQVIKFADLKRLPILIPDLYEQRRISAYLDQKMSQIDNLIIKKGRMIHLLKEERTILINQAVTKGLNPGVKMKNSGIDWLGQIPAHWNISKIKYVCDVNKSALPETTEENYDFNYIDIGNVDLEEGFSLEKRIDFVDAPSRARRIVRKGDTIISTVRTYLKAIAYFEEDVDDIIVSTGFAVISPHKNLLPKFLYYVSRSEKFIDRVCALSVGVSYPAINSAELSNVSVWFPEKDEQNKIVEYLDRVVSKTKATIIRLKAEIEYLKEYRTALISEAVTGKIDIRERT